ncbi:MAG: N-acetylmuramoyl-L-alanine amidase family protein [Rhodothermales bacterium]
MKIALVYTALLTVLLGAPAAGSVLTSSRPSVERVSLTETSDHQGFVLRLHTSDPIPAYTELTRVSGQVMEMTLFNTSLSSRARQDPPAGPVVQYQFIEEGSHLKLRLSLKPDQPVLASAYRDRGSPDLLIGLTVRDAAPVVARRDAAESASSTERSSSGERWRLNTIVIDAGHGGKDHGAVANGVREKDVVLAVARKLGSYLENNLGVRVVYTRTDDRFIELRQRGRIANEAGGKLFISIHANSAPSRSAIGTETFFLGPHKTEEARRVMEKENRVVMYESDPDHYQAMDEEALIRQTLAFSSYVRKSQELADVIEQQFAHRVGRSSRGVKQAPFYVLWSASMPSVLIELGFLTNPREAAFLASEDGQTYLASAIFRAVRDYKHAYERGLNLVRSN